MLEAIRNIDISFLSADLLGVILVLIGVLIFSYSIGKDYGVTMLIALYISAFPIFFVPQIFDLIPNIGVAPYLQSILQFSILFLITFYIISKNGFFESPMVPSKWEIGAFGLLATGLLLTIIGTMVPTEMSFGFSSIVISLFYGDTMLAFWSLAPIGFWVLIKGE
jgi:hypothetical protein